MNLTLYDTKSNPLELNKNLTLIESVGGRITAPQCDVLNPIFEIDTRNADFNYLYCDDNKFKRYYFIDKIEVLRGGKMALHCKVDVLMTYRNDILNSEVIAQRSSTSYNKYVPDNYDFVTAKKRYSFSRLPFTFNTTETSGNHYILTIGGK